MTPRKAAVLAMKLPAGCVTWASCGFDSAWTAQEHLAANLLDAINGGNWQRSGGKGQQPKPYPRPAEQHRAAGRPDREQARAEAFLARQADREQEA